MADIDWTADDNIGVCWRRRQPTLQDYSDAADAVLAARGQLASVQRGEVQPGCAVCGDTGHTSESCHHNPLLMARQWARAEHTYVCWHCGQVCETAEQAKEHFGPNAASLAVCQQLAGWAVVTAASHPVLHATLEAISHDCGAGAGHESYSVPPEWAGGLATYEAALSLLPDECRIEFAIGDSAETERMAAGSTWLRHTSNFLNAFFCDYEPGES